MYSFLISHENVPFSIASLIVIFLGIFELMSLIFGLSLMGAIDDWLALDTDVSVDGDVIPNGFTGLLGWLCLNRLPLLIWLVMALCSFSMAGYGVNFFYLQASGSLISLWVSFPLALFFMCLTCRYLGPILANLLPKDESSAIDIDSLNGCVATVTVGEAKAGMPAEAVVRDIYQQKHYVFVEPDEAKQVFPQGSQVVLLSRQGKVWSAARLNSTL